MIRLPYKEVLQMHQLLVLTTGGVVGVREKGLLESALEAPFAGFDGREFYPTIEEKAARLGWTLVANHAFVDGNKRIGLLVMLVFLKVNDVNVDCSDAELVEAGLGLAAGTWSYEALLAWIHSHTADDSDKKL